MSALVCATTTVVVVGGGPRGSGILERLVANATELPADRGIVVHIVEPFAPGAGRIWHPAQSPLLWANSQAGDITMFTDDSCRIDGPIAPGPTFLEWAGVPHAPSVGLPALEQERAAVDAGTFPSRRLLSEYLTWVFRRTSSAAAPNVSIWVHRTRVVDVTAAADGRQLVHLASGEAALEADVVVLAHGHLPGERAETKRTGAVAASTGLTYLPEGFADELDLSVLRPSAPVILRGAGLAFIDLLMLLTQGRGGRFVEHEDDPASRLEYRKSGREPQLYVGSRRGVPYHSKITYRRGTPLAPHPRFLDPAAVDALLEKPAGAPPRGIDFRTEVWPLVAKELAFGYYYELFAAHPEAVHGTWQRFEAALARYPWGSEEFDAVVTASIPDSADRFAPETLDRPLSAVRLPDAERLQDHLIDYIEADVARRSDSRRSADLGLVSAIIAVLGPLRRIDTSGRLSFVSTTRDLPWFYGFFSFMASGPPPRRLRELAALMRAGVVRFLGSDVDVTARPAMADTPAVWVATSPSAPGEAVAPTLVEARLPPPMIIGTADPLLAALYARGEINEQTMVDDHGRVVPIGRIDVDDETGRILGRDGRPHPARYAFLAGTGNATPGAFARPNTDAAFFRQNDRAARAILGLPIGIGRPQSGSSGGFASAGR